MTTTTKATTTTLNNPTKKKNKKYKPFRVKLSSIVAIRYNKSSLPTITSSSSSLLWNETWLHPLQGRDCHYNLIGKYIRCIFPKRIITMMMMNEKQLHEQNKEIGIKELFLEGEIIELVSIRSNDNNNGIPVKLLIDKKYISTMPFLKHYQIREEREKKEDGSNNTNNNNNNETKMQMYEERIRGKNKVIIELILANGDSNHYNINQNSNCPLQKAKQKHVKWLIRKWIPKTNNNNNNSNNNNTNAMIQEIGNDYDTNSQKERNFRWYHTMLQYNNNHNNNHHHHHHEYYNIGQVIKMDVNNENLNTTNDDHGGNKNGKGIKRKRDLLNNSSSSSHLLHRDRRPSHFNAQRKVIPMQKVR